MNFLFCFVLLSIPFLIIPNIQFTFFWFFFLVASEPWTDVFIQDSLLSRNTQLRAHHFYNESRGCFSPHSTTFCLYTLNFICHFISQSLSLIRTFCNSSPFTTPLLKANRKPVAQQGLAGTGQCRETHPWANLAGSDFPQDKFGTLGDAQSLHAREEFSQQLLHEILFT